MTSSFRCRLCIEFIHYEIKVRPGTGGYIYSLYSDDRDNLSYFLGVVIAHLIFFRGFSSEIYFKKNKTGVIIGTDF